VFVEEHGGAENTLSISIFPVLKRAKREVEIGFDVV